MRSAKINAIVPPKVIPPCQSAAASGTFPTEQTKLIKAMTGPIIAFSILEITPRSERNSVLQNEAGINFAASPATTNPTISSVRSILKSPMV